MNINEIKKLINSSTAVLVVLSGCYLFFLNIASAQVINALPGVLQNTQFLLEQMNGGTLPPPPPANSYDFASDFFSLNGNISPVSGCRTNQLGQTVSFFDNFNDGLLNSGCTANFSKIGTFQESSSLLHMKSDFAAPMGIEFRGHIAQFNQLIQDGGGDLEYITSFRPDTPNPFPNFSIYGISIIDDFEPPFFESSVLQIQPGAPGQTLISAFRSAQIPPGPTITNFTPINLSGLTDITLKLRFEDATNRVFPSFSIDNGVTFTPLRNPDNSLFFIPAFTVPGQTQAAVQVFAAEKFAVQTMIRPTVGGKIVQLFKPPDNPNHTGIDIDRDANGESVRATADGTVVKIATLTEDGCGKWVWISHGNIKKRDSSIESKITTVYLHMDNLNPALTLGPILQGTELGKVDSTGNITGPHLHFEVRQGDLPVNKICLAGGTPLDPLNFVDYDRSPRYFDVTLRSNADVILTDPDGFKVSKQTNQIPDARYIEIKHNIPSPGEGLLEYDSIQIDNRKNGDYLITVIPEPQATLTDIYSLSATSVTTTTILVQDILIRDIPDQPYIVRVTDDGIEQIIPVSVRIEPTTINLSRFGTITAFIQISKGFGATINDINPNTIVLSGASPKRTRLNKGADTFIAQFNTRDLVNVSIGDEVDLTISGQLVNGISFEGNDTIGVIKKGGRFSVITNMFYVLTDLITSLFATINSSL